MNKLHFKGDHRKFIPNRIVGPDRWGAWYLPVSAHYFDGVTTIFYRPVPPDQLPAHAAMRSQQELKQRQKEGSKQWPVGSGPSPSPRLPNSSLAYQISRRSGGQKKTGASGGTGLTKSQRELLKRFKRPTSR